MITNLVIEPKKLSSQIYKSMAFPLQGKIKMQGLVISIENRKGSVRSGTDDDGKKWSVKMKFPYGYILGVKGVDKDHLDCFVGDDRDSEIVFVVNQNKIDGKTFDEHKVMLGFKNAKDAKKGYLANYNTDKFFGSMKSYTMEQFKKKIGHGKKVTTVNENTFEKAIVKQHTRTSKTGKMSQVREYEKRNKRIIEAHKMVDESIAKWKKEYESAKKERMNYIKTHGYPSGGDPEFDKIVTKTRNAETRLNRAINSKEHLLPLPK